MWANCVGLADGSCASKVLLLQFCISALCLVIQSCLTLYDPTDCSPPGSSVHGDSPSQNTGVGCHALLQGIFPTQGLNPGLPHYRWILYHLSHTGKPKNTGVGSRSLLQGIFPTQELNQGKYIYCLANIHSPDSTLGLLQEGK